MIGVVEKIINGGWGIVREKDKLIFLSYVLPKEEIEYEIKDKAKGIYWGKTLNILSPSQFRKEPKCPLYGECGGCIFQHIDYEHQKTIKTNIFKDDMQRIGGMSIDIDNFFDSPPYKYRIRGRLKAENSGKIGFIKKGTHNIIPINNCLLFSDEMNDYLTKWNSQTTPPFFFQQDILLNRNKDEKKIFSHLSHPPQKAQIEKLNKFSNLEYSWKGKDDEYVIIKTNEFAYRVKPSTFFQVNRFQHENMLNFVKENIYKSKVIIDLYSGVGFFIPLLLKYAKKVIGVESYPVSVKMAKQSFPKASFINENVDKFKFVKADIIISDPPRSGLSKHVINNIIRLKYNRLIYISCSSASFARDAKILLNNGYSIEKISLIDLFPQTSHIEILSVFTRNDN